MRALLVRSATTWLSGWGREGHGAGGFPLGMEVPGGWKAEGAWLAVAALRVVACLCGVVRMDCVCGLWGPPPVSLIGLVGVLVVAGRFGSRLGSVGGLCGARGRPVLGAG